jgi:hypothetical protein
VTYTQGAVVKSSSETGSGTEEKASGDPVVVMSGIEPGSGAEAALFFAALSQLDAGLGAELYGMLKDAASGDSGSARDALKLLLQTAGAAAGGRLPGRAGQGEISSQKKGIYSGRTKTPSKGVNI